LPYSIDPVQASLRARIGAYAQHAAHDTRETTRAARAAFNSKFEHQVDPDGVLPEAERQRRAQAARSAHFARLALASACKRSQKARNKKKATAGEAVTLDSIGGQRGTSTQTPLE
jgi:hypothetical protein